MASIVTLIIFFLFFAGLTKVLAVQAADEKNLCDIFNAAAFIFTCFSAFFAVLLGFASMG